MNERTKTQINDLIERFDMQENGYFKEYVEKLVELTVKECCNVILHYTDVDEGVSVVKKHFGVE